MLRVAAEIEQERAILSVISPVIFCNIAKAVVAYSRYGDLFAERLSETTEIKQVFADPF